jgi:hypothetical protein
VGPPAPARVVRSIEVDRAAREAATAAGPAEVAPAATRARGRAAVVIKVRVPVVVGIKEADRPAVGTRAADLPGVVGIKAPVPAAVGTRAADLLGVVGIKARVPAAGVTRAAGRAVVVIKARVLAAVATKEAVPAAAGTKARVPAAVGIKEAVPAAAATRVRVPAAVGIKEAVPAAAATRVRVPAAVGIKEAGPVVAAVTRAAVPAAVGTRTARRDTTPDGRSPARRRAAMTSDRAATGITTAVGTPAAAVAALAVIRGPDLLVALTAPSGEGSPEAAVDTAAATPTPAAAPTGADRALGIAVVRQADVRGATTTRRPEPAGRVGRRQ